LDFTDTSTYRNNCGKVLPSGWTVKKDSCELHTPYLKTNDTISRWMEFSVKINQSGNLTNYNNAYVQHQVNLTPWETDTVFIGEGLAPVAEYFDSILLDTSDLFRIRIIYETDHQTRFWELKNGDIKASVSLGDESILPVELINFNAERKNHEITIIWETASEINNDYFCLQQSYDAFRFDSIAVISGNGNNNHPNRRPGLYKGAAR